MNTEDRSSRFQILAACGSSAVLDRIGTYLGEEGYLVTGVLTPQELEPLALSGQADLLLLHHNLGLDSGLEQLKKISTWEIEIPILCITPRGDVDYAIQSLQHGAVNYVIDQGDYYRKLPGLIEKAIYHHQLKVSYDQAQATIHSQALLLNYVHDAVVAWDTDDTITYCNFAARSLFGMKSVDCLGQSASEKYFSIFSPAIQLPDEKGTQEFRHERRLTRPDGTEVWVNSRISYVYDPLDKNRIIGYMDISRDITERKRLDAEIEQNREKMVQAQRLAEIGELASGVAHQINNPLTAIIGEAQLAKADLTEDDPASRALDAIEEAGWKAQEAVAQLMEFSREPRDSYQPIQVNESIQRSLMEINKHNPELVQRCRLHLSDDLPPVLGNSHQLENLWTKLITGNRRRGADRPVSVIRVITNPWMDQGVTIEVSDDGDILSAEELEHFFDPDYYQEEDPTSSGLSYSICREIVRQHQGEIRIINQGAAGTNIQIFLPGG